MKKLKKVFLRTLPVFVLLMVFCTTNLFAIEPAEPAKGTEITKVKDLGKNIWSTISVIVQIAAIAAIVFAGVRYMFASSDEKANIKKQTVILMVGAILVFAAVPVAKFVTDVAEQALNK